MEAENLSHGTAEEIKFINGLGTYAPEAAVMNTKSLLNRYIRSLDKRSDFCGMDKEKLLKAAIKRFVSANFGGMIG